MDRLALMIGRVVIGFAINAIVINGVEKVIDYKRNKTLKLKGKRAKAKVIFLKEVRKMRKA